MGIKGFLKSTLKGAMAIVPKSEKKIIFESFSDFCDNSRALYEYLIKEGYDKTHKLIWCVDNPELLKATHGRKNVVFTSFRKKKYVVSYLFHMATSKTIFYTHVILPMSNTKTQQLVCLWHGIPLKNIILSGGDSRAAFNFMPSSGKFYEHGMKKCFSAFDDQFVTTGFPRNDLLFEKTDALTRLNIDTTGYEKVILWMPTYRKCRALNLLDGKETETGFPLFESFEQVKTLDSELKKRKLLLVIKLHPLQDKEGMDSGGFENIKLLTNKSLDKADVMLYHLVATADVLLTDYSSVYLDYLLLNRPIGFLIDDIDEYQKNKGFVVDNALSYMPGQKVKTIDELYSFFDKLVSGEDEYKEARNAIMDEIHVYKDGNSCERIAKRFLKRK